MVNESLILGYLEDLVEFSPRKTGTYGCEKAGEYIYEKFIEMGLETRMINWTSFGNKYNPRYFSGTNIEATLNGINNNEEIIIFNAHYDSVKKSPGADDDGSGVAAVLAAAYALSKFDFETEEFSLSGLINDNITISKPVEFLVGRCFIPYVDKIQTYETVCNYQKIIPASQLDTFKSIHGIWGNFRVKYQSRYYNVYYLLELVPNIDITKMLPFFNARGVRS